MVWHLPPAGFSNVEIFRKYLWFMLRERAFDEEALADLVALKAALGLTDEQVGCWLLRCSLYLVGPRPALAYPADAGNRSCPGTTCSQQGVRLLPRAGG